jgi:osmoprotectant transport system substrate-binding protein
MLRSHPSRRRRTAVAAVALAALVVAACGDDDGDDADDTTAPVATDAPSTDAPPVTDAPPATDITVTVGSANFPENQLLAEIYGQALEANGITVERSLNIGSREVYFAAIDSGEIDLLPEYTNSLLSYTLRLDDPEARPAATNIDEQVEELRANLPDGLTVLEASSAEDKDVIVCRAEVAEELGIATLPEMAAVADQITLGAPPEFETRAPFGLVGFEERYGAQFEEFVPLNIGGVADALSGGAIDCGNLFSTMSIITTGGFVAMEDVDTVVPNEAVIPVIRAEVATPEVTAILDEVSGVLDTDKLKAMMVEIEVDAADPAVVAQEFLTAEGLA